MESRFQNVDLLKSLIRGKKKESSGKAIFTINRPRLISLANSHPENVTRTPTPGLDLGSLEFAGFGPAPCLDLKPTATTELATDGISCAISPSHPPPPYELHVSPVASNLPSTDRPLSTDSHSPSYSTTHIVNRLSTTILPIFESYSDSKPPSSGCDDVVPEQLRNGLKALFHVPTSTSTKGRRASSAVTVYAGSVSSHERSIVSRRAPASSEQDAAVRELNSLTPQSKQTIKGPTTISQPSEITEIPAITQHISGHTVMAELDGSDLVFMPTELDVNEPVIRPAELGTESEKQTIDKPEIQTNPLNEESGYTQNGATTGKPFIAGETSDLSAMDADGQNSSELPKTGTNLSALFEDRPAHTEFLER
ncbi:uncharacterized protein PG998_004506 [Apiospora kogelbergensis]|uniref:uncharacterized protein n=1 Tax=Apiospora kogelbergensis TaxID=1337665 RepID=UPI0031322C53